MRLSLQTKMLVATVAVLIVGNLAVLYYSYATSKRVLVEEVAVCLGKEAVIAKHFLEEWLEHARNDVAVWGTIPSFADAVTETGYYGQSAIKEAERRLNELASKYRQFEQARIYCSNGESIASSGLVEDIRIAIGDRTYFKESMAGKTYVSKIIKSRYTSKWLSVISAPIKKDGRVVGIVVGTVSAESMTEVLKNIEKMGQKTTVYLFDENNEPIISSKGNIKKKKQQAEVEEKLTAFLSFLHRQQFAKKEESNHNKKAAYFQDDQYIYVYSPMKYNGWKVVELTSISAVKQAEKIIFWQNLMGAFLVISVVIVTLFWIYRINIFSRLMHLRSKLELLEQGVMETRISRDRGNDEISSLAQAFNRTATELQNLIESLRSSREQFRLAVDGSNDGIWDWDITDDVTYFSPRWYEQLGYNENELERLYFSVLEKLVHKDDVERVRQYIQDFLNGEIKGKFDIEFRMIHKDGSPRWIHSRASMVTDKNGCPIRLAGAHTDTTKQRLAAEQLQKAKKEAEESNRIKGEFLANMSHEIRTPIGFITGLCHMIKETELDKKQIDYVDKIQNASKSLLGIINNILDFSKIEAGKLEIDLQAFNIRTMFDDLAEAFAVAVDRENIELTIKISPELPDMVVSDPLRLGQILTNLVSNAIKFTNEGEIDVTARCLHKTEKEVKIAIIVGDTGIGMTLEEQARLFQAFSQADASISRKYGGTGLGLVICRDLVKLLGGTIDMESEQGKGTKFTITLTMGTEFFSIEEQLERAVLTEAEYEGDDTGQRGKITKELRPIPYAKVLLVEDNDINIMIAESLISKLEIVPDTAKNGREALERVKGNDYDLILMDVQMPIMDGYTATRKIRELDGEKYKKLPIIAMTANAMKQDVDAAKTVGMSDHLSKPIEPEEFYQMMNKWLVREA